MLTKGSWQIFWSACKDETMISYNGKTLELGRWQRGMVQAMEDLESQLKEISGGKLFPLKISPDDDGEEFVQEEYGYSWLKNSCLTQWAGQELYELIRSNLVERTKDGEAVFNRVKCHALEVKLHLCRKLIFFLVISAVAPPVDTQKVLDIRIVNGERQRNLFKICGKSLLIFIESKSISQATLDSFECNHIPPRLSRALDYFMVLTQVSERIIGKQLYSCSSSELYRQYLFVSFGRRLTVEECRRTFR